MLLTFFQKILLIKIVEIVGTVPKSMIHDNESHSKNIGYYYQKCAFGLLDRTLRVVRHRDLNSDSNKRFWTGLGFTEDSFYVTGSPKKVV